MGAAFSKEAEYVSEAGRLSDRDIARATGADADAVGEWMRRTRTPAGRQAERLTELSAIVERLARVVDPECIPAWIHNPVAALDGEKPLDVLARDDCRKLSRLISKLESPTFF